MSVQLSVQAPAATSRAVRVLASALELPARALPPRALAAVARAMAVMGNRLRGIGGGALTIEDEVRAASDMLPREGAVVFDVGANKGDWTRCLFARAGDRIGAIHMFEPSQAHRESLASLVSDRCRHLPYAVGSKKGVATLFADFPGSGLGSLHQRRLDHFGLAHAPQHEVEVVVLDDYAAEHGIERVDFLKMDIEGHELEALHGARRLLSERRIRALSFEFGGSNIDSRTFFQDFWYELTSLGFDLFRILPGGRLLQVRRYTEDLEAFVTTNYLAKLGPGGDRTSAAGGGPA